MIYKFLDKTSIGSGVTAIKPNYQLASELKQIININKLLEILRKEKFIHHLETILRKEKFINHLETIFSGLI